MQCHVSWWNLLQFLLFSVNLAINREHACIWFKIPEAHEPMMDVTMDSRACHKIIWEVQEAIYLFVPALRLIFKKQWIYRNVPFFFQQDDSSRSVVVLLDPVAQEVDRERLSTTMIIAGFTGSEIHSREWLLRVKIPFFKLTNKKKSITMNWTI